MAQLSTVLPNEASGVSLIASATGGPTYQTTIFDGATGVEKRVVVWSNSRHVWTVTFKGKITELQDHIDLFDEAKGQGYSFLWSPPGYSQGSFRFSSDELRVDLEAGVDGDVPIATITVTLMQVPSE